MIVISKTLLAGVVGLTFAGIVALASNNDSGAAVQPESVQGESLALETGGMTGALPGSSVAPQDSDAVTPSDESHWTFYQNHPGCPSSACSMDALFHMAH